MVIDEPGPSQAPSGLGYIEPTSSLLPLSTNDYLCDVCKKYFTWKDNLKRHEERRRMAIMPTIPAQNVA
ncbi:hypothetical protein AVEN_56920-1 [Araneus ventricosus]|uniref:C2H2-type domain-containing protein n=1 Tax=Araneus ventricosus TaxID=182803 RepID=A0A4Y2EU34_ARAVE|nr:hypothetical protein AVEN_56920-1 [Araneus ventricosus]